MDIGEIVSDAIKYPSSDWTKVIILGVIFIASILIVPIFLAMGYLFRIIKATFAGVDELPDFDEIGDMFIDGLKLFVVGIVYAIPVVIIAAIISAILAVGQPTYTTSFTGFDVFGFILAYVVYLVIAVIVGLIEYIAIANMALYEGDLGAAFRFSEILDRIKMIRWGKYLTWWIIMILLGLVAGAISLILGIFTFGIGFILVILIIYPYFAMFSARSLALLFASSEEDLEPE